MLITLVVCLTIINHVKGWKRDEEKPEGTITGSFII